MNTPTLLQIDSSPMKSSISRELTREYAAVWKQAHPEGRVIYRDLAANPPLPIDAAWIGASYTPPESRTGEQNAALALSDEMIAELEQAGEYVIGVPMHNFSVPGVLKLWMDQVVRKGRTFAYESTGPRGLLEGKRATIIEASGGIYSPGTPGEAMNHIDPMLKTVLGFMGVSDVKFVTAAGAAFMGADRAAFLKPAVEQVRAIAA